MVVNGIGVDALIALLSSAFQWLSMKNPTYLRLIMLKFIFFQARSIFALVSGSRLYTGDSWWWFIISWLSPRLRMHLWPSMLFQLWKWHSWSYRVWFICKMEKRWQRWNSCLYHEKYEKLSEHQLYGSNWKEWRLQLHGKRYFFRELIFDGCEQSNDIEFNFRNVKNVNMNFVGCALVNGIKTMGTTNMELMENALCMIQMKKPKKIRLG